LVRLEPDEFFTLFLDAFRAPTLARLRGFAPGSDFFRMV